MSTRYCIWAGLSFLAVLVYWDVWSFEFVNWDDGQYVYENSRVKSGLTLDNVKWAWTTTFAANWHPLTWLSLMLDTTLFGHGPGGFHTTNLILHCLNAMLVFELFRRLTGESAPSACVAALFAIHPIHVESVAWISERKDVLNTLFGLMAIRMYVEYALAGKRRWYWASLAAFALCLVAKQMLVTLPCLLLLLDVWPLRRLSLRSGTETESSAATGRGKVLSEKTPYLLLTVLFCAIVYHAQQAGGALNNLPLKTRILNAIQAYGDYLTDVVVPTGLIPFYPHPRNGISYLSVTLSGAVLVGISVVAFVVRKPAPFFITGWCWFLGTLVPVIGIVQVGVQQRADRYMYVPAIGLYVMVVWALKACFDRLRLTPAVRTTVVICGLGFLTILSYLQVRTWRDSVRLWLHAVHVSPDNARAESGLAAALESANYLEQAAEHYERALKLQPDYDNVNHNYAVLLFRLNRHEEAAEQYRRTIALNPRFAEAHMNLGLTLWVLDRNSEAEACLKDAIRENSSLALAHYWLGRVLVEQKRFTEARESLQRADGLDPTDPRAREELEELSRSEEEESASAAAGVKR